MEIGRQSEIFLEMLLLDDGRVGFAKGYLLGCHTGDLRDLLLKATDTGLVCIFINYFLHRRLVDAELLLAYSVFLQLFRHEVTLGDLHLLFGKIAGDIDQFHPVEQGGLDRGDVVRRGDEQHVREVVVNVQIIVVELNVLLRIKHFQKSRGRVALVVVADLVNLIQNDDRVGCAGLVDSVEDTSRKSSHISLPVTTQLSLIVHAAEGYPDIFPAQSLGD